MPEDHSTRQGQISKINRNLEKTHSNNSNSSLYPKGGGIKRRNQATFKPATEANTGQSLRAVKIVVNEGEEGTDLAAEGRVAVIVDALRASATLCSLLEAGASEVRVMAEVDSCLEMASTEPDLVTVGERGGLRIEGFHLGNSPREALAAIIKGKTVAMTTTTGALRVVESMGSPSVLIGSPRNLSAVSQAAAEASRAHKADIVVVAAGATEGPVGMAVEDLASASLVAGKLRDMGATLEPGAFINIPAQALPELFQNCPNGRRLKELGLGADVPFCAELNRTRVVPYVADWLDLPNGDVAAVIRSWQSRA